jgi:hypothetical protein
MEERARGRGTGMPAAHTRSIAGALPTSCTRSSLRRGVWGFRGQTSGVRVEVMVSVLRVLGGAAQRAYGVDAAVEVPRKPTLESALAPSHQQRPRPRQQRRNLRRSAVGLGHRSKGIERRA